MPHHKIQMKTSKIIYENNRSLVTEAKHISFNNKEHVNCTTLTKEQDKTQQ